MALFGMAVHSKPMNAVNLPGSLYLSAASITVSHEARCAAKNVPHLLVRSKMLAVCKGIGQHSNMSEKTGTLVVLEDEKRGGIRGELERALEESGEMSGVMIVALVDSDCGEYQAVRIYWAGLDRLRRGGILAEAAELVRNPVDPE